MTSTLARLSLKIIIACVIAGLFVSSAALVVMRLQGMRFLTIETGSMQPTLTPQDLVIVRPSITWPKVGQIVSYKSATEPATIITHRVQTVDISQGFLVTKGDNTSSVDSPIRNRQVSGIVIWHSKVAGQAISFLRHPAGLVLGLYVPALAVIIYELRHFSGKFKRSHNYTLKLGR